ncbi:hypothetical protein GGTG_06810 [Gaeumannomyces tritici R3-111a-1]|uniref:Uncharacterized protein n=1 Tax=Gaeumannomyces tritici (strain R3-111a-1) TaxID=644352 RepID=J3NZW3_GAET3|nr:hypothetical protein GGTG_06810 [Gaeumannomyces tritici R3-111a-1]EJT76896.1 hypothetical protein GGTG_06810 [Gaeumannomyces tritici R3-111a-1]
MRRRAFKVSTMKSAWSKCGLWPFNPEVVLDNLEDPLTSAKSAAVITQKVGYIPDTTEQIRRIERRVKKATHAAILAGAGAVEELRRREQAQVERKQRASLNRLITKIGPISVDDARLRAINNEGNRLAFKRRERRRLRGKERQEGTRLKQLRARMRLEKAKCKEIADLVRPQEDALANEATVFGREEDDVALPPNWQPTEALSPYTPWRPTARDEGTVWKVVRFYCRAQGGPEDPPAQTRPYPFSGNPPADSITTARSASQRPGAYTYALSPIARSLARSTGMRPDFPPIFIDAVPSYGYNDLSDCGGRWPLAMAAAVTTEDPTITGGSLSSETSAFRGLQ